MFTIKHVSAEGNETIYSTTEVSFTAEQGDYVGSQLPGRSYVPATVWYLSGGELRPLTGGVAYVMNESGATVAKYALAPQMPGIVGISGGVAGVSHGAAMTAAEAHARAA
jgi:hypothetical protein